MIIIFKFLFRDILLRYVQKRDPVHRCRHVSVFRMQNMPLNLISYGVKVKNFLPQIDCGRFVYLFAGNGSADRTSQPMGSKL